MRWSYTRYELMDIDGRPAPWRSGGSAAVSGWIARPLVAEEFGVTLCSVMIERPLFDEVGGCRERFSFRQDFDLVVRIALLAPVHAVDESLVRAREHVGRHTKVASAADVNLHGAAVFHALAAELEDASLRRIAHRKEAGLLVAAGKRLLRRGELWGALGCFRRAVGADVRARF